MASSWLQPVDIRHPYVRAQLIVESEDPGSWVTMFDGTAFPRFGFKEVLGKNVAGGLTQRGYWHRLRTLACAPFRPDWLRYIAWAENTTINNEDMFVTDALCYGAEEAAPSVGMDPRLPRLAYNYYAGGAQAGKRREGFSVLSNVATVQTVPESMYSDGGLAVYNDVLYSIPSTSLATGYDSDEYQQFLTYGAFTVAWSHTKKKTVYSGAAQNYEIVSPSSAATVAAAAGGAVTLGAHNIYIVYKNAVGRRSGPSPVAVGTSAAGNNTLNLTNVPVSADAQVTAREVYMTQAGGTVAYLQQTIADNVTTTASITTADTALSATVILQVDVYGTYFTSSLPTMTRSDIAIVWRNKVLAADQRDIYHTPNGYMDVWSANYKISLPSRNTISAMAPLPDSVVVATRDEIFVISGNGAYSGSPAVSDWQVTKVSDTFGVFSPKCIRAVGSQVYGIGMNGPWVYDGDGIRPLKKPNAITCTTSDWSVSQAIHTAGGVGFDTLRREVLMSYRANEGPEGYVTLAYPIDEPGKMGVYDLAISSYPTNSPTGSQVSTTGVYSAGPMACDFWGNLVMLGPGSRNCDGYVLVADTSAVDPSPYVPNTVGTIDATRKIITLTTGATGFPGSNGLRGVRVVCVPADATKPPEVRTVTSNTSTTFSVGRAFSSNIAAGAQCFLQGIMGMRETGGTMLRADPARIKEGTVRQIGLIMNDVVYDSTFPLGDSTS